MAVEKQNNPNNGNKISNESDSEKRYIPRWEVSSRVIYQLEDDKQPHESNSKDLSCTGTCFTSPQDLPLHQKIKMKIYLAEDLAVKVEGQVAWNKPLDGKSLVGVTFSNLSQAAQDLILKHAFEIKKDDMIKYWYQGWNKKQSS